MGTSRIIRRAEWSIGPDREEGASPPIRVTECTTCGEASPPSEEQPAGDRWAIAHAGSTAHRGYREIVTVFLRVAPAPGNPLFVEEGV